MRRLGIMLAAALTLAAFTYGDNRTGREASGQEGSGRRVIGGHVTRELTEVPKGKALVEKLPEGVEGVELKDGVVKIKPGYKFVKKDNKVTVMRSAAGGAGGGGRLGVGGSWSCVCKQGAGGCSTMVEDNQIYCAPGGDSPCGDKCVLSITIKAARTGIMRY